MGLGSYVVGISNQTGEPELDSMLEIVHECDENGVDYPEEVVNYFKATNINPYSQDEIDELYECDVPHEDWTDGCDRWGIEVNVADIPEGVKTIRFWNSW